MKLENMTLQQKIGQMLVAGFSGTELNDHIIKAIKDYHIGNVILFARNFKNPKQLYNLNKELQQLALKENGIPLFITIDQEGGMVTRITNGATFFPGNMALSAGGNEEDAYLYGKYCGEELKAMGINFNLAPVLDVNNNKDNPVIGIRSYGEDPERVSRLGLAYIKGIQENGIIATGKHFPGHGDTKVDSHLELSSVNHNVDRLEKVELYPFNEAIKNGIKAIMSAHVMFPAYEDRKLPATLSDKVLTGLLRNKLNFKGLILTDCMEMNAIDKYFGTIEAAAMAIKAGADMIFISHTEEKLIGALNKIMGKIEAREIEEDRINESVRRIMENKFKVDTEGFINSSFKDVEDIINNSEHKALAEKISNNSITIVRDNKLLPVKAGEEILIISTNAQAITGIDDSIEKRSINDYFQIEFPNCDTEIISLKPSKEQMELLLEKSKGKDKVIICTYNANLNIEQIDLVNKIYKCNKNIIMIPMRNPYDVVNLDYIPCVILAYEYTPISIKSVVKVVKGEIEAKGMCPVTL